MESFEAGINGIQSHREMILILSLGKFWIYFPSAFEILCVIVPMILTDSIFDQDIYNIYI